MTFYLSALHALTRPDRLRLARVIDRAETEVCISELTDILRLPQYAVSRAASTLRHAGIIRERRSGKLVYYRIADDPFVAQLLTLVRMIPADDDDFRYDFDRLRWRLDIREADRCVVTHREEDRTSAAGTKSGVLFVCSHNSARSQIAEEYLRRDAGDLFEVESAGLAPGQMNPYVVRVLAEDGIDVSSKKTRSVFDVYRSGRTYSHVITVCSREAEKNCPVFPGPVNRLNWPFPDPSRFEGSAADILAKVRQLRNEIQRHVIQFANAYRENLEESAR